MTLYARKATAVYRIEETHWIEQNQIVPLENWLFIVALLSSLARNRVDLECTECNIDTKQFKGSHEFVFLDSVAVQVLQTIHYVTIATAPIANFARHAHTPDPKKKQQNAHMEKLHHLFKSVRSCHQYQIHWIWTKVCQTWHFHPVQFHKRPTSDRCSPSKTKAAGSPTWGWPPPEPCRTCTRRLPGRQKIKKSDVTLVISLGTVQLIDRTLLGPLKTQTVLLRGQPPLLTVQGFLGTQTRPSPSKSALQAQLTFDPCVEHWALTSQLLDMHMP